MLAFGTQVRGFKPGRSRRICRANKPSARLPSVPCRRFTVCKISLNLRGSRNFRQNYYRTSFLPTVPPFADRISRVAADAEARGGESGNV